MLLGGLLLSGCAGLSVKQQQLTQKHQSFYLDYETNFQDFHREIDISLQLRKRSIEFLKQEMLEGDAQYFDAHDIARIQAAVSEYSRNREVLLKQIAYRYRDLFEGVELIFTSKQPTELVVNRTIFNDKNKLFINPNDPLGREYIKVIKLGLAAALTLYDNFIIAIMPYHKNGHFRRSINENNIDDKKIIERISGNFRDLNNYRNTLKAVEFNDKVSRWELAHTESKLSKDKDNTYFNLLINGSYSNKKIKEITLWEHLAFRTKRFRSKVRDILFDIGAESLNSVSMAFGNTVGLISSRDGYLKNLPSSHIEKIETELLPGDILLEKTPFRLTDRFIPGHWGHVAIWVGSKEQLEALGVWKLLPQIYANARHRFNYQGPSFQTQIIEGKRVVEALRPGVQINTLKHFLDIDDMAVLRDKNVKKSALKRYVIRAFKQIGKEYDFNFDVETDTKIVCSELAFVAYDDYQWPTEKMAGRYTISPDHVGEKALGRGPFEPVMLYHDGKVVGKNVQLNFNRLMSADYGPVKFDLMPVE